MADQEGAEGLPDPQLMSNQELIQEVIANRAQIAHDKEQYRKARDFLGDKLRTYHEHHRQQEEALHFIESRLREANKLLGRDPDYGINLWGPNGEKRSGPIPVFVDEKIRPPVFDPQRFGLK